MELFPDRNRALGVAGTIGVHALVIAVLLLFAPSYSGLPEESPPSLVAVPLREPPPPAPPPDDVEEGAAAPPSRGVDEAPSPPEPPAPLARPTPAEVARDPGSDHGAGLGAAAGSGAGQGGEGSGSGSGGEGSGRGAGRVTPPVRIAGGFTGGDYRAARLPRGAIATVRVSFRVRSDGSVDRCSVIGTSGYGAVDEATCRILQQRFRYRPATDQGGRAIEWEIRTEWTWAPL